MKKIDILKCLLLYCYAVKTPQSARIQNVFVYPIVRIDLTLPPLLLSCASPCAVAVLQQHALSLGVSSECLYGISLQRCIHVGGGSPLVRMS